MKKLVFILIASILIFTATTVLASAFCNGWEDGYIAGYCYKQHTCLRPTVPLCPLSGIGENTYQHGYNRGFLAGLNAQRD